MWTLEKSEPVSARRANGRRCRPGCEVLEGRAVPATFSVTSRMLRPDGITYDSGRRVGVWERGYSDAGDSATSTAIPVVARDTNSNGFFDGGLFAAGCCVEFGVEVGGGRLQDRVEAFDVVCEPVGEVRERRFGFACGVPA